VLRRKLPNGQILLVHGRTDGGHWHLQLEGVEGAETVGFPLNSTLADLLGYRVAHEDWPGWIDRVADELAE
jgi:hypothetical protein